MCPNADSSGFENIDTQTLNIRPKTSLLLLQLQSDLNKRRLITAFIITNIWDKFSSGKVIFFKINI